MVRVSLTIEEKNKKSQQTPIKSKGGWTGKYLTMVDDLYGPGGTKNQNRHFDRNFDDHFLVGNWLRTL